jgi:hypothetical protein
MLERFSDQAGRVVVRAREEARTLNHNWIGTEHLMLGLIGEGSGMAAHVLESLGISLEAARWVVEETIGRVELAPSGQLQFTPRAKKVLEMALGQSHGYDHVGTWHILLGLLQEGDGVGAIVLVALGADQYRVGLRVNQLLHGDRGNEAPGESSQPGERAYARLLDNPLARIDALDRRLAAVEHRLGLQPDLGDLDQQTVTVPRETAAAVDMQEFETATGLRGHETQRPAPPVTSAVAVGAGRCWSVAKSAGDRSTSGDAALPPADTRCIVFLPGAAASRREEGGAEHVREIRPAGAAGCCPGERRGQDAQSRLHRHRAHPARPDP